MNKTNTSRSLCSIIELRKFEIHHPVLNCKFAFCISANQDPRVHRRNRFIRKQISDIVLLCICSNFKALSSCLLSPLLLSLTTELSPDLKLRSVPIFIIPRSATSNRQTCFLHQQIPVSSKTEMLNFVAIV
jgi:hypothetical protein